MNYEYLNFCIVSQFYMYYNEKLITLTWKNLVFLSVNSPLYDLVYQPKHLFLLAFLFLVVHMVLLRKNRRHLFS